MIAAFPDRLEELLHAPPISDARFVGLRPKQGIYLFSENGRHLYIGRSNRIRSRYGDHTNPSSGNNKAAFAMKLARESTGRTQASYQPNDDSRDGLMSNSAFETAFNEAKARIRRMQFRWIDEPAATTQCLLEVYCAEALATPYNDFDTH